MPFKRKLPDRATLAAHCDDGMTPAKIAERYDCRLDSVRHHLQTYGLLAVKSKSIPIDQAGKGPPPRDHSKRGIFLRADRVTIMRDTCCEFGGLAIRPMSLPRVSMHIAQLAKKYPSLMRGQNA
jgi:hypothetical protein